MYTRKKLLLVGGLLAIIVLSWTYGIRSWFFEANPEENDAAVKAANQWIKLAEAGPSDQLAALTRKAGYEKFIQRYKADTESLGMLSDRYFCRRSSYSSKQGRLVVAEYEVWFDNRKRPVPEKIFMIESKTNGKSNYMVIDARYIVPLPRFRRNGINYVNEADTSAGDPVALSHKWFNLFDYGKLQQCSYISYPQLCFNKGRFFFDLNRAPMDQKLFEHLKKMYIEGCPRKRQTLSIKQWSGIPGASLIKIFCMTSKAEYDKFTRIERIWAYKDCYHSTPQWLLFAVDFGRQQPYKKAKKTKRARAKKITQKSKKSS